MGHTCQSCLVISSESSRRVAIGNIYDYCNFSKRKYDYIVKINQMLMAIVTFPKENMTIV